MLSCLPRSAAIVALAYVACHPATAEEPKTTRYLTAVVGCLNTLTKDCTDTYGSEHSPMLCSLVDLKTHRIPEKAPPLLREQRKHDRAYPGGNLQHDLFTLLAMYHASKLTGQKRFAQAADAYLEFFLRRCASAGNGLFPYGEHAFWDFRKEAVGDRRYLQFAEQNADWAMDELYSHGLFRAATGKDYYEAANGVGPLLIELLRLHLLMTGSDYDIPRYYAET